MKILITGSNGFIGKIIRKKLNMAYECKTLSRKNADYNVDITQKIPPFKEEFDIVFHTAGKAHVLPKTALEIADFYDINTQGTVNLLQSLEPIKKSLKAFVFISSVSVYGKTEGENLNEKTPLDAKDPYGHSKILAEKEVLKWGINNNVTIVIFRLPLVVGENPEGNLKKMIRGIEKGYYFSIGKGDVRKSMVLATDLSSVIPRAIYKGGVYNLTDGYNPTVRELEIAISRKLNKRPPFSLPYWFVWFVSRLGDFINLIFFKKISPIDSVSLDKITSNLTFSDIKAREELGWSPTKITDFYI